MDRIHISGSTEYDVIIERDAIGRIGEILDEEFGAAESYETQGERVLIVTDENVADLYLAYAEKSLRTLGYETMSLVLEPGDKSKSLENYELILTELAYNEFRSSDAIIALGGGMIGDLAGFASATYKRGMRCIQMPTTLLAAVDSSVGGKTAINLPTAKNQVGVIHNPSLVICDPKLMVTLPERELRDGYAEIIKYGILNGYEILNALRTATENEDYTEVIRRSVEIKRDYVEMDEDDRSFRQFLNLGHLIGHAIEACENYEISHGAAVARGLVTEARCCALSGFCEMSSYMEIRSLLEEFGFGENDEEENLREYSAAELMPFIMRDKRIRGGSIQIIVPQGIGNCIMRPMSSDRLETFVRMGM